MVKNSIKLTVILVFMIEYCFSQIDSQSILGLPSVTDTIEMNNINDPKEGSLVYNIDQKNIFYFDGTNWISSSNSSLNLYSTNGTLSNDRTLDGNNNSLTFSDLTTFSLSSSLSSDMFSTGPIRVQSTGNSTTISGTGIIISATASGINLNGNTFIANDLSLMGSFNDSTASSGTNDQILTSTSNGTRWVDTVLPKVVNKTSNYTLLLDDNGKIFTFNSTSNITLTVPSGLPIGFNISLYQTNTGQVTIQGASGVTVFNRLSRFNTAGQHAGAGLVSTGTNSFHLTGDLKL